MVLLDGIGLLRTAHLVPCMPLPATRPNPEPTPPLRTFATAFPHLTASPRFCPPRAAQVVAPDLSNPISIVRNGVKSVRPAPASVFGAAERMHQAAGATARTPHTAGASDHLEPPSKRACHHPDQNERTDTLTSKVAIYEALAGIDEHGKAHDLTNCENTFTCGGERWPCFHQLYGKNPAAAFAELERKRKDFLSGQLGSKGRGREISQNLAIPCVEGGQSSGASESVWFQVSKSSGRCHAHCVTCVLCLPQIGQRRVCKHVFRLRYPVSMPTLNRLIIAKKHAEEPYSVSTGSHRLDTSKSMYVISWWLNYAEKTCERLPDTKVLVTPRRHMVCLPPRVWQ